MPRLRRRAVHAARGRGRRHRLPVDSEHNAIFQALGAGRREDVRRIILTASGGPFRTWPLEAMSKVTVEQALKHPTWSMGPKVTIDSATLMNKGLELIEAHHLFALGPKELDVVVHPQSVVHGLVEFRDGSVIAQLGSPDMRIPIAHCLAWPVRMGTPAARLDLARIATLTFEEPDLGAVSGAGAGATRACGRRRRADHPQCRQRDRGARVRRPPARISAASPRWSRRRSRQSSAETASPNRNPSKTRSPLTIMQEG